MAAERASYAASSQKWQDQVQAAQSEVAAQTKAASEARQALNDAQSRFTEELKAANAKAATAEASAAASAAAEARAKVECQAASATIATLKESLREAQHAHAIALAKVDSVESASASKVSK